MPESMKIWHFGQGESDGKIPFAENATVSRAERSSVHWIDDGSFHTVDSSDLAFRICAQHNYPLLTHSRKIPTIPSENQGWAGTECRR